MFNSKQLLQAYNLFEWSYSILVSDDDWIEQNLTSSAKVKNI